MDKKPARLAAHLIAASLVLIPASAATININGTMFDPEYYAAANPDVVQALGTSTEALYNHYITFGKAEGRKPAAENLAATETQTIADKILALKSVFPEGTPWTNETKLYTSTTWHLTGRGCFAFAMQVSDAAYGPTTKVSYLRNVAANDLAPGDVVKIITMQNTTHAVVVIGVSDTSITVCEGNYNKSVHWGRVIPKSELEGRIVYVVRRG